MNPAVIVLAGLFTGATSLSIGLTGLQALQIRLHRHEALITAGVLGSAALSLIVFGMLVMWVAKPWCFALVGATAIAVCLWRRAWRIDSAPEPAPVPRFWKWLFGIVIAIYGTYTFAHALAPEVSPDGIAYHLGTVGRWFRAGGLEWYTTNMYANMPMGIEMLFLFAYSFGRHSAAALVHWQFYMLVPFILLSLGRRCGYPVAGAVAGLLVFLAPVAAVDGASSYVDMAAVAVVVVLFSLLLLFEAQHSSNLLVPIGVLSGFAYTCKMTAFPALPFALGYVAWVLRGRSPGLKRVLRLPWRPLLVLSAAALVFVAPWLIKNALMTGNPFSPFLNRLFPNPYVRISFEDEYRTLHRTYYGKIKSFAEIPKEVTVKGAALQGLLGPAFLLVPIALFALRWPLGRRALLAAVVFGAAYPSNIGTRFLLLPLPFLSLAMGLVLSHWHGTALAVVLFHTVMSWPAVLREYADPYAWRLDRFRWKEALRIEPEERFFARVAPTVLLAQLIEKQVPPHGRVLTYGGVAEAYTSRDILVVYQAGLNNLLGEILASGFAADTQGSQKWMFRFVPARLRRLRLVQTRTIERQWAVSEMRVYSSAGGESPRTHNWRLRAHPNPWDVQLAFDNCPITRWMTAQPARPGDFVEVDFLQPLDAAAVLVELAPDQANAGMRIDGEVQPGAWKTLADKPELVSSDAIVNARAAAVDDLKRFGITHLAIGNEDFIAQELYRNQDAWRISLVAEAGGARLYKLN